jgi:CheY-like chemotaxis protein
MRILIVDDEPMMHDSYRRSFAPVDHAEAEALSAMAAELFGDDDGDGDDGGDDAVPAHEPAETFDCVHHMQGLDAVAEVERARADDAPFAVAFIDIRMPPGIDGKETARRIRALDPDVNIVIVTG